MAFNIFRKKDKAIGMPKRSELDIPPLPIESEDVELPTFPSMEDFEKKPEIKAKPASKQKGKALHSVEDIEKEAVKEVEGELGEREELELKRPLFIEAKLYKGVMDDIGILKTKLKDSTDMLQKMSDLKDDREKSYSVWHKQIEDIQRKLMYADNSLFRKNR